MNGNANDAVQPAAGEEVSNSETPDPPLDCNGLFVVFGFHKGRFEAVCRRAASCAIANTSLSKPIRNLEPYFVDFIDRIISFRRFHRLASPRGCK
jgi:hypothetical protein